MLNLDEDGSSTPNTAIIKLGKKNSILFKVLHYTIRVGINLCNIYLMYINTFVFKFNI